MRSSRTSSYCSFSTLGATLIKDDGWERTLPHGPQLRFQKSDANTPDGPVKNSASGWLDSLERHHWRPHSNVVLVWIGLI